MDSPLIFREIDFRIEGIETDALLYREKCHLLLPESFSQNLFYAISGKEGTRLFFASDSMVNINRLQSFFSKLYGTSAIEAGSPPDSFDFPYMMGLKMPLFKEKEFYYPGLVRNLFDYRTIEEDSLIKYTVSLRSGVSKLARRKTFGMSVSLSFDSEASMNRFTPLISSEFENMRRENGVKMKRVKKNRLRDTSLHIPFNLINFIRIPTDKDLALG